LYLKLLTYETYASIQESKLDGDGEAEELGLLLSIQWLGSEKEGRKPCCRVVEHLGNRFSRDIMSAVRTSAE